MVILRIQMDEAFINDAIENTTLMCSFTGLLGKLH